MSRYRKVQVRTWGDKRFRELTPLPPCGQGLWFFLMTGPHTGPIPGLFRAGRASMAEELNWSLEGFDKAFAEVFGQGMVKADFEARVVWLPNAIKHNKPESPNVVKSWGTEFDLIPECALKLEAYQGIKADIYSLGKSYSEAFDKTFGKPSPKPFAKTMPNQEQDQKQEQEQEQKGATGSKDEEGDGRKGKGSPAPAPFDPVADHAGFLRVKAAMPKRAGRQRDIQAELACHNRIEQDGQTWESLEAHALRYARYCRSPAVNSEGTTYVISMDQFFSAADEPWRQDWEIPQIKQPVRSTGQAGSSPILTHDQREARDLAELKARRDGIGLADFRDPTPGETADHYRHAQDEEFDLRRDRRSSLMSAAGSFGKGAQQ